MLRDEVPSEIEVKKKRPELIRSLAEAGLPREEARNVILIHNRNLFIDMSRGVQYLNEVIEMVKDAFEQLIDEGPLAKEPCMRVKVKLMDAKLHEDPVHRGPAQIMPATRYAIREGMLRSLPTLLEPKQIVRIDVPVELMGEAIKEVEGRRGQVLDMREERGTSVITAKIPVAEIFGFDAKLKSVTGGRGFYSLIEVLFEKLPAELRERVIKGIRKRKGLPEELPVAAEA
jgi:elongation factor 2